MQAVADHGAGDGWLLLMRYGVCQGLIRWQRGCAQTHSPALAGDAALAPYAERLGAAPAVAAENDGTTTAQS